MPLDSVTVSRPFGRAGAVAVTVTPGSGLPLLSRTMPLMEPYTSAYKFAVPTRSKTASTTTFAEALMLIGISSYSSSPTVLTDSGVYRFPDNSSPNDNEEIVSPRMSRTFRALCALAFLACGKREPATPPVALPSILFVTLDTTRDDAIGPEAKNVATPAYNALVKRGLRFRYAYATVPQTLPSHASMLTGLYPAGHGVRENSRYLAANHPLVAERLHDAGYRTAAFVSAFALAKRFGLARGFDVYDEDFGAERAERTAKETTDRVLAWLDQNSAQPLFLWVHYYDPHYPYTPPEPYKTRYAKQPYYGEVASMDEELGRLVAAFEQRIKLPVAIIIAADHGEGLGDHGE